MGDHRGATGPPLWCHVMLLIGVLEFAYYDMMPTQLHLMMVVAAVAWRELEAAQAAAAERRSLTRRPRRACRPHDPSQRRHQAGQESGALERPGVRAPTAGLRLLPDYLIIGAQRAGTTSLHRYLVQHPGVRTMLRTKGVHFFDVAYEPRRRLVRLALPDPADRLVGGQAPRDRAAHRRGQPYYLFHPQVPGRVAEHLLRSS